MPSLKDIRVRIASVKNTQQITRAMKMVSAAKLRRAQINIVNLRPYANKVLSVIADIAATHRVSHPLLSPSPHPKKILLVVVTSDRGLCGGFNANVNKFAERFYQENKGQYEVLDFLFVGRKAGDYFRRRGIKGIDTITNLAREISYVLAASVAERLMKSYSEGGYDEIRLVYNEFKSAISQNLVCETLLPIDLSQGTLHEQTESKFSKDLIFEPAPEEIIEELLHKHFAVQVYRCMSESVAAEHAARMTAMENATSNAKDMIDSLTLTYNKLRQASITKELIEICSGAEALKG
ncbi:MAG: ATP synthase F1 subunit gamma [Bdellovibrionales bacterium]|nr:ATP synthase F1 subunit gamma [Bdellovibrionales bacterium]